MFELVKIFCLLLLVQIGGCEVLKWIQYGPQINPPLSEHGPKVVPNCAKWCIPIPIPQRQQKAPARGQTNENEKIYDFL